MSLVDLVHAGGVGVGAGASWGLEARVGRWRILIEAGVELVGVVVHDIGLRSHFDCREGRGSFRRCDIGGGGLFVMFQSRGRTRSKLEYLFVLCMCSGFAKLIIIDGILIWYGCPGLFI